jgi:hypothetical protein
VNRPAGALACIGLACWIAGCGGGGSSALISRTSVRECLANAQIGPQLPKDGSGYAPIYVSGPPPVYLDTAPDFTAYTANGVAVDVVVRGSAGRAQATAAHVRSVLSSLGTPPANVARRVVSGQNVAVVFTTPPSAADRSAVRSCLSG